MVLHHPLGENRAAAADDSRDALGGQRNVLDQHARVDGHVIHALLGLLFDHLQHHPDVEVFHAAHARQSFIDRHRPDRHRRVLDDGFANPRNIAAGGQIHHRVGAVLHGSSEAFRARSSMSEVVEELPILALILQQDATPMHIGSRLV